MCQIVEDYAQEKADFQKALDTVKHIESLMANGNMSAQEACKLLSITYKAYKDAKKLLSESEVLV